MGAPKLLPVNPLLQRDWYQLAIAFGFAGAALFALIVGQRPRWAVRALSTLLALVFLTILPFAIPRLNEDYLRFDGDAYAGAYRIAYLAFHFAVGGIIGALSSLVVSIFTSPARSSGG